MTNHQVRVDTMVRVKKEFEMLVTSKTNIFSFFFGKPHAASNLKARSASKAQKLDDTNLDELDKRISITKSEDFYKAHSVNLVNPFNQLNR
jgi:hypothetical protein